MSYGNVYVASIAMGADRNQTLRAIREAEAHKGPSIIIAYAPCMLHGINMTKSQTEAKRAVEAGYWPLYSYNPANTEQPFKWETKEATASYVDFIKSENRYRQLEKKVKNADEIFAQAAEDAKRRMAFYKNVGEVMK
jgi:pyruvate-ferredoxin/flavodoxin oxidoreductase